MATGSAMPAPAGVLERERELLALAALLDEARAGRGRLLVLEGPPGIGKSTLLEHASAAAAEGGVLVLRAAGRELERELGWGVARSLFEVWLLGLPAAERDELLSGPAAPARALFAPEAGVAGAPEPDPGFALLHGLSWLAVRVAERGPLLLVVDDAQWADEPSLRCLVYLLGRLREQPIALLVAARSGESGAGDLLAALLSDPAGEVCELAPLSREAVGVLVRQRLSQADDSFCGRAFEWAAGNPLFVRELVTAVGPGGDGDLRAGAERAAASLERSVRRRLSALPAAAQALARAVAVFEGGVELERAAALAGVDARAARGAADALARVDILRSADPLEFAHPLLRAAVYAGLGRQQRAETHADAARLLAEQGAPAEHVGAHLLHAGPARDEKAVDVLREAAATALAHGVPDSAIAYLQRALREPPGPAVRPELLAELGDAELRAGREDAIAHLRAALALTNDARGRAAVRLSLGRSQHDFGHPADACATYEAGLVDLQDDTTAEGHELALDLEAGYLTSAIVEPARAADAHRRVAAAVARAGRASSRAERLLASKAMSMRLYAGGSDMGGTCAELATVARGLLAGGRLVEDDGIASQALAHVLITLSFCDDYAAAEEAMALAGAEVRRQGSTTWRAALGVLRGRQRGWTGSIPDAVDDARGAVDLFAAGRHIYLPSAACVLVRALLEQDEPDEAARVIELVDAGARPSGAFAAWHEEAVGRLAAHRGELERALDAFQRCGARADEILVSNPGIITWRSEAGLAAAGGGDHELAHRLIGAELALAERFGAPRAIGVARRAAGLVARGEDAVDLLRSAADLHAGCGAWVEQARSLTGLGGAIRRAGRPAQARAPLRDAIALADRLGARTIARQARMELVLAGGRVSAARDRTGALTPSERRVADLAADGCTNREIANALFVTLKTVEWHLGNAYRKLDVRRRHHLRDALSSLDGEPGR